MWDKENSREEGSDSWPRTSKAQKLSTPSADLEILCQMPVFVCVSAYVCVYLCLTAGALLHRIMLLYITGVEGGCTVMLNISLHIKQLHGF